MNQYEIKFQYADELSNWEWRNQSCSLYAKDEAEARLKCIDLYGLGNNRSYRIISLIKIG